ncbi:MAG: CerR family C-terminal domain-containing protein [Alphaproteobacteria bacterium]
MVQTIDPDPSESGKSRGRGRAGERGSGREGEQPGLGAERRGAAGPGAAGGDGPSSGGAGEGGQASASARLVEASGPLFAEQGFDAVSTREIARAAGVNLSAITYHFGGKERLYEAVIQRLIDDLEPQRQALIGLLRGGVAEAGDDRRKLARLASDFVGGVLSFVLTSALPRWRIQLMLREINQPSAAFALIMGGHIDPLQDALAELVAAATGHAPGDEETRLLTQGVVGQCMLFGLGRSVVLWRLGWDDYTPERIARVIGVVTPAVLATLGLGAAETGGDEAARRD